MSYDAPPPVVANPPASSDEIRPQFVGKGRDFRRIVIPGALLELVTFGFYRFWLATKMRRHLWSNTLLEGEPFEYMGTTRELLIGFLFALAILAPIYFLYFLAGVEAERLRAFASIPLFAFIFAFRQFAIYRARRYRLTRTMWRGVRFWMEGSGLGYAWRACLWSLLVYLTLGLALPWSEASLERYKMRRTHYGDLQGDFAGKGWDLFKRGWWLWLIVLICAVISVGIMIAITVMAGTQARHHGHADAKTAMGIAGIFYGLFCLTIAPMLPFLYAAYKAIEWRWWASGLRFGKLAVTSNLKNSGLFGNYWATIGWAILLYTILGIVVGIVTLMLVLIDGQHKFGQIFAQAAHGSPAGIALIFAYAASYLATILGIGAAVRIFLIRGVWQKVVASLTITGIGAADSVTARGEAVNALGEGFADSLDIAGF